MAHASTFHQRALCTISWLTPFWLCTQSTNIMFALTVTLPSIGQLEPHDRFMVIWIVITGTIVSDTGAIATGAVAPAVVAAPSVYSAYAAPSVYSAYAAPLAAPYAAYAAAPYAAYAPSVYSAAVAPGVTAGTVYAVSIL